MAQRPMASPAWMGVPLLGTDRNSLPRLLSHPCHVCSPATQSPSIRRAPRVRTHRGCRINCLEHLGLTDQKIRATRPQSKNRHPGLIGTVRVLDFAPHRDLWVQPQWAHGLPRNCLSQIRGIKKPPTNGRGLEIKPTPQSGRGLTDQTIHHNIFLQEECDHRDIHNQTHKTETARDNGQQDSESLHPHKSPTFL